MKIYMHEYSLDTSLLLSDEGHVLGVYLDSEDAQNHVNTLPTETKKICDAEFSEDELPLDFDDAA